MNNKVRWILLLGGLALILLALAALAYALLPGEVVRVQATLAPTLFNPP